jgi:hypothetical protein
MQALFCCACCCSIQNWCTDALLPVLNLALYRRSFIDKAAVGTVAIVGASLSTASAAHADDEGFITTDTGLKYKVIIVFNMY